MNPQKGEEILNVLKERDQKLSLVTLVDGKTLSVANIAWGKDMGDEYDHITTNASPSIGENLLISFLLAKSNK